MATGKTAGDLFMNHPKPALESLKRPIPQAFLDALKFIHQSTHIKQLILIIRPACICLRIITKILEHLHRP